MSSKKKTKFVPTFTRIPTTPHHYRTVLDEKSFVHILREDLTKVTAQKKYGINQQLWYKTKEAYQEKYVEELRQAKHRHYSVAMKGNTRGARDSPATVIPKATLKRLLDAGETLYSMAEKLKTTEWFIRRNLVYHDLGQTKALPYKMRQLDWAYLEKLEGFSRGITQSARNYYADPHTFFLKLYEAYCRLSELVWFVKEQAGGYRGYREKKKVPRDHICWSPHRVELVLSFALLEHQIPHIRQFSFYKRYLADFAFPGTKLLVEVDGASHLKDSQVQKRDKTKALAARRLGYQVLHFTNQVVLKRLPWAVSRIKSELSKLSVQ